MQGERLSQSNNRSYDYFLHLPQAANAATQGLGMATSDTQLEQPVFNFPMNMRQTNLSQTFDYSPVADHTPGLNTPTSIYQHSPGFTMKVFPEDFESATSTQSWTMDSAPIVDTGATYSAFDITTPFLGLNLGMATPGLGLVNATPPSALLPPGPLPPPPQPQPPPPSPLVSCKRSLPSTPLHSFEAIPGTSNDTVENFIKPSTYEARRFICTYCTDMFTGKLDTLREHVRKHLGITKLFRCLSCGKTFTTQRAARRHQQTQSKNWNCQVCGQSFARLDYAKKHRQRCETRHGLIPQPENPNFAPSPGAEEA